MRASFQLCECGCGKYAKLGNQFIYGHNWVGRKHSKETKIKLSKRGMISSWNRGRKLTDEHKRKISESNRNFYKDREHPRKGIPRSEKTKTKLSITHMGEKNGMYGKCGKLHHNWKGGMSRESYCHIWTDKEYKQDIKNRDNNKCQNPDCLHIVSYMPLNIHHIDYNKLNCHPWNLITLCHSCNSRANFNREYWIGIYQNTLFKKYKYKELI